MFVLLGYRKNGDTRVVGVSADRKVLSDIISDLHYAANYNPSQGFWDTGKEKAKFWIVETSEKDIRERGINFTNVKRKEIIMQGKEEWYVPEWSIIRGRVRIWWSFPSEEKAKEFSQKGEWYGSPRQSGLCVHCCDPLPPEGSCYCRSTWFGGNG